MSPEGIDRGVGLEIEGNALRKLAVASHWLIGLARRALPGEKSSIGPAEREHIRQLALLERIIGLIEEMRHELVGLLEPNERLMIEMPCEKSGNSAVALCRTLGNRVYISDIAISMIPIID